MPVQYFTDTVKVGVFVIQKKKRHSLVLPLQRIDGEEMRRNGRDAHEQGKSKCQPVIADERYNTARKCIHRSLFFPADDPAVIVRRRYNADIAEPCDKLGCLLLRIVPRYRGQQLIKENAVQMR